MVTLKMVNNKMSEKLLLQKKNIENNTPRIAVGITAIFAIPSFYYLYQAIDNQYQNPSFYKFIKLSIDWINIKYAFLGGVIFSLEALKFQDLKVQNKIPNLTGGFVLTILPVLAGIFSLTYQESHNKFWILATQISLFGQIVMYTKAVNQSIIPFWVFNLLYHVYALDLMILILDYYMLRNLGKEIKVKPYKFIY